MGKNKTAKGVSILKLFNLGIIWVKKKGNKITCNEFKII